MICSKLGGANLVRLIRFSGKRPWHPGSPFLKAPRRNSQVAGFHTSRRLLRQEDANESGNFWQEWVKFPVALGVTCLAMLSLKHHYDASIWVEEQSSDDLTNGAKVDTKEDVGTLSSLLPVLTSLRRNEYFDKLKENLFFLAKKALCLPPYRWISGAWGEISSIPLHYDMLKKFVFRTWAWWYSCDLHEIKYPLEHYESLSDFFRRTLRDGVRTIESTQPNVIVSPVDAKVLNVSMVPLAAAEELQLESVKGRSYRLDEFCGHFPEGFSSGSKLKGRRICTVVLYLDPGNYHHFHSPVEWTVKQRRHFPGTLMPVKPWFVSNVENSLSSNERVVLNGKWQGGFFSLGAVGALNVGSIVLAFDQAVTTNNWSSFPYQRLQRRCLQRDYPIPIETIGGQPLGSFNFGSTVVLVFESSESFTFAVQPGQNVKVGEKIGTDGKDNSLGGGISIVAPPWPGESVNELIRTRLEEACRIE